MYAVTVGAFVNSLKSHAVSQNMIQRYLSLPTLKDARRWMIHKNFLEKSRNKIVFLCPSLEHFGYLYSVSQFWQQFVLIVAF